MGRFITIPGTPTVARPKLYPDARLNAGSLVLLDMTYGGASASGVPVANDRLTNVAESIARTALGNPAAEVRPQLLFSNWAAGLGALERSTKGGLHGIVDNPIDTSNNKGFYLSLPTAIQAHILANPTHQYLVNLVGHTTRASGESSGALQPAHSIVADTADPTGKYLYRISAGLTRPNTAALTASRNSPVADAVGSIRPALALNALTGSPTALASARVASWGNNGGLITPTTKPSSWILYSYGLEDLTISGRTAAEAMDAWDAWYTKHVATAGGRYYGDTWTDPATV